MSMYTQWYNENSQRRYPFNEHTTLMDISGNQMPDNIILDCSIMVGPEHKNIYIPYLKVTPHIISLGIASDSAGLFTGTFHIKDTVNYKAQQLDPLITNATGWMVFSDRKVTEPEIYRFNNVGDSGLDMSVIRKVANPTVTSMLKLGDSLSNYVAGIVRLKSGSNVKIYKHETSPQRIVVELLNSSLFAGPCNPKIDIDDSRKTLHSINDVKPDSNGILTIRFDG